MKRLAIFVLAATFAMLFTFPCQTRATLINLCLAENGGVLEEGTEAMRDGDFEGYAQWGGGQSGGITTTITFPDSHVEYVKYHIDGAAFKYDGDATVQLNVYLRVQGSWTSIFGWSGSGWEHFSTGVAYDDNGGNGWNETSGIRAQASFWGYDTGSAGASFYEVQAWAIPEPATVLLLGLGAVLVRRKRS